ncbi:MAG TPA: amidohydrolase [Thermoleophilia bacterium]|nr:amidohydrolase [Thermoleophilia bacterium]
MTTIYRAEWLLPITAPPVKNGAVAVDGDRIVAVGSLPEVLATCPGATMVDFDQAVLLPGFVNAHSHLEYTSFRGMFDDEQFGDWIIRLIDVKASLTPDEYLSSARLGALEALSSGVTTIADTTYTGESLAAAAEAGLRGIAYLEVFGIDDKQLDETLADLDVRLAAAQALASPLFEIGLGPHATYTVSSRLFQTLAVLARERHMKVASHVAESKEELTYIRSGSGKFAHDYREKMGWERMLIQPYGVSPIKYLQQWGVFDQNFLAVHCVHASIDDIRILKAKGAAVAHCPKSNAKTGCGIAPLPDLLRQGVRVGFGTDSPAASNIMDMFDEMRTALFLHRGVERDVSVLNAAQCIRIATLGGAEALGLADRVGSLEAGKQADLIAVDVSSSHFVPIDDPCSALVYGANQDDVLFTCVAGEPLYQDGAFPRVDAQTVRAESRRVRAKLQARVGEGRVRVGSAESGWWHTPAATDQRET